MSDPATLPVVDRMALAVRLAHALGVDELTELVSFFEERADGTFVLVKEGGRITDTHAQRRQQVSEARRGSQ